MWRTTTRKGKCLWEWMDGSSLPIADRIPRCVSTSNDVYPSTLKWYPQLCSHRPWHQYQYLHTLAFFLVVKLCKHHNYHRFWSRIERVDSIVVRWAGVPTWPHSWPVPEPVASRTAKRGRCRTMYRHTTRGRIWPRNVRTMVQWHTRSPSHAAQYAPRGLPSDPIRSIRQRCLRMLPKHRRRRIRWQVAHIYIYRATWI